MSRQRGKFKMADTVTSLSLPCTCSLRDCMQQERELGRGEKGRCIWNWTRMPKRECHQGLYDPGAFKLDHFQPVKLILFQKKSTFLPSLP